MTAETLRDQAENLISEIKKLPEPDRTSLLREVKGKCNGSIASQKRDPTRHSNISALNEARKAQGVSAETRQKLAEKTRAAWAARKAAAEGSARGSD